MAALPTPENLPMTPLAFQIPHLNISNTRKNDNHNNTLPMNQPINKSLTSLANTNSNDTYEFDKTYESHRTSTSYSLTNPHPLLMPKPSIMPISSTYKSTTKSKSLTPTPKSFVRLQPKSFSTFSTKKQFTTSNHTIPISSLITQDETLKTHKQNIYITKHNSQRDSLSPSQSPAINTPQSDTLQSNSHSDSDSDSDIEVLHTPQSPTPQPLSFWNKNRNSYNSYNSNIFKKRFNRNYEPLQPATKKRKLNNNSNNEHNVLDLCDSSDDDKIISNGYSHIDNPNTKQIIKDVCDNNTPTSNIDNDDKEVLLYGISIGTHSHHWIPNSQCNNRPKIIFNQNKDSMDIYLNSTNNDYVPVSIDTKNVGNLIIPKDASYFSYKETVGQYINVIFLVLKEPLIAYKWLQEHFCPKNIYYDAKSSSQTFITIYIDVQSLNQLQSIILKKHPCSLVDRFVAKLNNEDKYEILRLTPPITSAIYDRWKQINEQKIHENETGLSEIESENENENDNGDNCDKYEADYDQDMDIDNDIKYIDKGAESDSSLSSKFDWENTGDYNNSKQILTDYKLYIENKEFIKNPHHDNSLLYVINIKTEPYYKDEKCYWVFPGQHGHTKDPEIFTIRKNEMNLLNDNEWLNDEIINFGMKYIYAAWPCYIKRKVYIFSSYWYTSISKILNKNNYKHQDIQKQTKSFVNVFDREYILIPIHDEDHWELMIVYNHNNIWDNRNNNNICKCYLIVLDSLNGSQVIHKPMFDKCKIWLNIMAESHGYNGKLFSAQNVITKCIKIPKQPNSIDCGCFLLRNVYQFGKDNGINVSVKSLKNWYSVNDGVRYRHVILDVMNVLAQEQEVYVTDMYKRYKLNKVAKKT